jgi:hypothetical protein
MLRNAFVVGLVSRRANSMQSNKPWNSGMLEYWNTGFESIKIGFDLTHHSIIPMFHYSSIITLGWS